MDFLKTLEDYARKNYVPVVLDDSAKFLAKFVKNGQYKNILEIGTAIGYSGSIMLLASPKATLTTIEILQDRFYEATKTFATLGLSQRVTQILGDGFEEISKLNSSNKKYDLIFLDGPKGQYLKYYPVLLKMLSSGGCLLVDNVLFHGMVRSTEDVGHKKRAMVTKLRQFMDEVQTREDLKTIIHEIGDGVAEIYLK